ncbi:methylated-DNA--[protein]-cysteine S-methyltransferase [Georgenia subflava]|uniref:Methylated-DNA--protein-cysteine methyltransferase n=1 Tax=Georgenia subflava TaxID=1622177 RepID=A0A6N7EK25_9MICO|nr:methylated-DNA--[protein]-cysteine S-methyltransferase [Georgenia subflava]MPV37413.1 methylated-DNA--[protein]-cysteine S-methyltransferase [Georgenia subflava]
MSTDPTHDPLAPGAGHDGVLAGLQDVTQADLDRLHARLVADAQARGELDVAYRTLDSPVGKLLLAATDSGLVRVAFAVEDHATVLSELATRVSPRILHAPQRLDVAVRQLEEYFAGRRRVFDLALDLRLATGFRREVLAHLPEIGFGRTATYTELAAAAGRPLAVRAAASACATNPVPLVVPCHRVLRADGSVGGYRGGPAAKQTLLALEQAA